jgi:hypothetical protein
LIRLIDESRHRAAVVGMIHDAPTRKCPAAALEHLERARCNSMLIDLRALGDPDALAIAQEVAAPDPGPATLRSEPEVEQATATLTYAPSVASVRLLLCLGVLVFLCLGVLVFLGLGTMGVTDASTHVSLGL